MNHSIKVATNMGIFASQLAGHSYVGSTFLLIGTPFINEVLGIMHRIKTLTIFNVIRWFPGWMGQTTHQPSV